MEIPQTMETTVTTDNGADARGPIATAHVALIAIATMVTIGLPTRSAASPASMQPTDPEAIVTKANNGAAAGAIEREAITYAQNAPIELHIA